MYLENDIDKNYTTCKSIVDGNRMVDLPKFCSVENYEKFVLIANNENSALVVPLEKVKALISELKGKLGGPHHPTMVNGINEKLNELYSSIIDKVEAIPMDASDTRYGIHLGIAYDFLDKPNQDEDECVIFQNVNGVLVMHYGCESFKKNVGENVETSKSK